MMNEYSMPYDLGFGVLGSALEMPVRQALCLHAVIALRHGWTWGCPSFSARDMAPLEKKA